MKEMGSIEYARKLAGELKDRAMRIFDNELGFLKDKAAREKLRILFQFVLERDY